MVRQLNKKNKNTTIQVSKDTLEKIKKMGHIGQNVEGILIEMIESVKKDNQKKQ